MENIEELMKNWVGNHGALALAIEDEYIDYHVHAKCQQHCDVCMSDVVDFSKRVLDTHLPNCNRHVDTIKAFQEEYLEKVIEFLETEWTDTESFAEQANWLRELLVKYTPEQRMLTAEQRPFGTILPYEIQDVILQENIKQDQELTNYLEWHVLPVVRYMEEKSNW